MLSSWCVMRRWGARAVCSINVPAKSGREREVSSPPISIIGSKQIFFEFRRHGFPEDELRRGAGDALIRDVASTLGCRNVDAGHTGESWEEWW